MSGDEDLKVSQGASLPIRGVRVGELVALLARVEAAEGPDRELFADICAGLLPSVFGKLQPLEINSPDWLFRNRVGGFLNAQAWESAALALCARVLPGWELEMTSEHRDGAVIWRVMLGDPLRGMDGEASHPALALVCAMLKALIASGQDDAAERQTEPRETSK